MRHHSPLAALLGTYILESRERIEMSQIELAEKLGFSSQFLGRIEKGAVMIPEDSLIQTIEILSLDPKKLVKIYVKAAKAAAQRLVSSARNSGHKRKKR